VRINLAGEEGNMQRKISGNSVWFVALLLGSFLVSSLAGCSVYMAAKQPSQKNMDVMTVGTPRSLVLAEIGTPVTTETRDGKKVDVFSFVQGYSTGSKTARALFHGAADIFTAGLWEAVATPTEAIFNGTKVAYEITYDDGNRIEKVVPLTEKSKEEAPVQVAQPKQGTESKQAAEPKEAAEPKQVAEPSSKPEVQAEK
jgi:outer membrane protein assembly factor BamE (lipoprotein component of BamABCDE complex)